MSSNTTENGRNVSLEEARVFIDNYQKSTEVLQIKTISMLLRREFAERILRQEHCAFLRFFMAQTTKDKSGQYTLVIVGADAEGNNIIEENGSSEIYEELGLCPPNCPGGGTIL